METTVKVKFRPSTVTDLIVERLNHRKDGVTADDVVKSFYVSSEPH